MRFADSQEAINNTGIQQQDFQIATTSHAFKVLSSSLYTDKKRAVIRELACNALDANVSNNKGDEPIIIILPDSSHPTLTVMDRGKGMNREILEHLYTTYFSSTKQLSDTDIGGFGLGSKSPFSITDNFNVTSTTLITVSIFIGIGFIEFELYETTTILAYLDDGMPKVMVTAQHWSYIGDTGTRVEVTVEEKDFQDLANTISHEDTGVFHYWEVMPKITSHIHGVYQEQIDSAIEQNQKHTNKLFKRLTTEMEYHNNYVSYGGRMDIIYGNIKYEVPSQMCDSIDADYNFSDNFDIEFKVPLKYIIDLSPSRESIEDSDANKELIKSIYQQVVKDSINHLGRLIDKYFIRAVRILNDPKTSKPEKLEKILLLSMEWKADPEGRDKQNEKLLNKAYIKQTFSNKINQINFLKQLSTITAEYLYPKKNYKSPINYMEDRGIDDAMIFKYPFENSLQYGNRHNDYLKLLIKKTPIFFVTTKLAKDCPHTFNRFKVNLESKYPNAHVATHECSTKSMENSLLRSFGTVPSNITLVNKKYINELLGLKRTGSTGPRTTTPIGHIYNEKGEHEPLHREDLKNVKDKSFIIGSTSPRSCDTYKLQNIARYSDIKLIKLFNYGTTIKTAYFQKFTEANNILARNDTHISQENLLKIAIEQFVNNNSNYMHWLIHRIAFINAVTSNCSAKSQMHVAQNLLGKHEAYHVNRISRKVYNTAPYIFQGRGRGHFLTIHPDFHFMQLKMKLGPNKFGEVGEKYRTLTRGFADPQHKKYLHLEKLFKDMKTDLIGEIHDTACNNRNKSDNNS